jgi:phage terminase large subunit-like protein
VQAGNVYLLRADWNYLFKGEHETFPVGKYKDQVDAAAAAFNYIAPTAAALDTWARLGK